MQQMESERAALRETLDARKKELAPTIQHLKELRQKHAALNAKIAERRKAHDDALSQLDRYNYCFSRMSPSIDSVVQHQAQAHPRDKEITR